MKSLGKLFGSIGKKIHVIKSFKKNKLPNCDSSSIFQLNIDCFEAIFDWLPFNDLNSLGQTCKRLQQYTLYYMRQDCIKINALSEHDGIKLSDYTIRIDRFSNFIEKLSIYYGNTHQFQYIGSECKSLKEIRFVLISLNIRKIAYIKSILSQIESVKIQNCYIEGSFHKNFLKFCPNLKRLSIYNLKIRHKNKKDWLQLKYPKLEHFELSHDGTVTFTEILTFLSRNPNIKSFATDHDFHEDALYIEHELYSDVKLDDLIILRDTIPNQLDDSHHFNQLYSQGFYKRFHIRGSNLCHYLNNIDAVTSLKALKTLTHTGCFDGSQCFCPLHLVNLNELNWYDPQMCGNIWNIAKSFLKLERVSFKHAFLNEILPFVLHSPKLKELKVRRYYRQFGRNNEFDINGKCFFKENILDLMAINNERKKLNGACRVEIYVSEEVFFATKWAIGVTHYHLVGLKRALFH